MWLNEATTIFLAERRGGMSKLSSMPIFQAIFEWTGSIKLKLTKTDMEHKRLIEWLQNKNKIMPWIEWSLLFGYGPPFSVEEKFIRYKIDEKPSFITCSPLCVLYGYTNNQLIYFFVEPLCKEKLVRTSWWVGIDHRAFYIDIQLWVKGFRH